MDFWLEYGAQRLELLRGVTLIGRSSSCQIVLNDGLVSRQHARITTDETEVTLEDLGSVNGLFVNEERLSGTRVLQTGDRLVVGAQVMILRTSPLPGRMEARTQNHSRARFAGQAGQPGDAPPRPPSWDPPDGHGPNVEDSETATFTADLVEILGSLADKNFVLGRAAEAERILQGHLEAVLRGAAAGEFRESSLEKAASYAVKLAATTGKASWIEYTFKLYTLYRRPLPRLLADDLYAAIHKVPGVSLTVLRDYLSVLHAVQNELNPAERFVVQRLEGLERSLAAR